MPCRSARFPPAPGEQGRARIQAEFHAIGQSGGNRHDVLECATHLDTDHIGASINARSMMVKGLDTAVSDPVVARGHGERNRQSGCHLLCKARTRERARPDAGPRLSDHLMGQQTATGFESLAQPDHGRCVATTFSQHRLPSQCLRHRPQASHRRGEHDQIDCGHGVRQAVGDVDRLRQQHPGQITGIGTCASQRLHQRRIPCPQPDRMQLGSVPGQCRAPCAGTEHGDLHAVRRSRCMRLTSPRPRWREPSPEHRRDAGP